MSRNSDDSFIEDLHNALVFTTYYDVIKGAVWMLLMFKRFNSSLGEVLDAYEKYLGE
jgi:hypothetical protein